jgi:hypothetical protein
MMVRVSAPIPEVPTETDEAPLADPLEPEPTADEALTAEPVAVAEAPPETQLQAEPPPEGTL